jgi:hypothetical protein
MGSIFSSGLVGTRRALSLVVLGFLWTTYAWLALAGPPAFAPMFLGFSATYMLAFLGVGAGYFWGRWYANGIGWSGAWSLLAIGQVDDPRPLLVYAGMHIAVLLLLAGRHMAEAYEGRADWRERLRVKEENVGRIGAAVTTVASLLPMLVGQLLAPRSSVAEFATLCVAAAGLYLLLRMRTAGLLLLAAAGAGSLAWGGTALVPAFGEVAPIPALGPVLGAGLAIPLAIFAPAIVRFLRAR